MAITAHDVKLLASQRLTDDEDGGGRMSGNEVVDGEVNNLFPDISRLDRVYGRATLRKVYGAVLTGNRDTYHGAHAILVDRPEDPRVHVTMFSTGSHTDERADARDRIESYVVQGPISQMTLLGDQLAGQRAITVFQLLSAPTPEVGEVYCLSTEQSGYTADQQYVRITDVAHEVRTFSDLASGGVVDFQRRVVTLTLSNPLRVQFHGGQPTRAGVPNTPTKVRSTQVADAARYFGVTKLVEAAQASALTLRVASIFSHIVPATQAESPVVDIQAGGQVNTTMTSGGNVYDIPAVANTREVPITIQNRQLNYTATLLPLPAPGTVVVEYRALGKWYRLVDNGLGVLEGEGSGSINYATGAVIVTLKALPDAPSSLLFSWGTRVHFRDRGGYSVDVEDLVFDHECEHNNLVPGSVSITWLSGAQECMASAGPSGYIDGDATGRVIHAMPSGGARLRWRPKPNRVPDPNSAITLEYRHGAPSVDNFNVTKDGSGFVHLALSDTPIKPGSLSLTWAVTRTEESLVNETQVGINGPGNVWTEMDRETSTVRYTITDDGAGGLFAPSGEEMEGASVNYATGEVVLKVEQENTFEEWEEEDGSWGETTAMDSFPVNGLVTARYVEDSVTGFEITEDLENQPLRILLAPQIRDTIVPGTVRFTWGGQTYVDRQGSIYRNPDSQGAGTYSGTIDYSTKIVTLTDYSAGHFSVMVNSLVTTWGDWSMSRVFGRTPGAPLRPGGFQIQATTYLGGDLITGEADFNGNIVGTKMRGTIDTDTGVYSVEFGEMVDAAGHEDEPWYHPDNVTAQGKIWRPLQVLPNTIRFNAVVVSTLPLDADLLGLDPVRLPFDGRVPIFRPADVIVVHNTQQETLQAGLTAGQVLQLNRDRLASCVLLDAEGEVVDPALYTADLATGAVTMADPLDLGAYTQPLVAEHRVEDMALVTDVQINGLLTLAEGLQHDYPLSGTYVSSALLFGDLAARVANFFSQQTWSSNWADARVGNPTVAQYNANNYPVEVTNAGAIRERWALIFTNSTTFNVVGESIGVIGTGNIGSDCAPINPETGAPYFVVRSQGWGSGWVANNVVRFNTAGAQAPIWLARTTLSGQASIEEDAVRIQVRGDAD